MTDAALDQVYVFPMSFSQQRLWIVQELDPTSPAYNICSALRLTGSLDVSALQAALNHLVVRHESLRTCFGTEAGAPVQIVAASARLELATVDTVDFGEALRLAQDEVRQPFDLRHGPLVRATLYATGPDEHLLVAGLHHIVADGWSMDVLVRELTRLYEAAFAGRSLDDALPDLPLQYADYAQWQQEELAGDATQHHLEYWRRQLADAPELLAIPADHPRPPVFEFRGGTVDFTIDAETIRRLDGIGREAAATPFMTLLSAWAVLLGKYSRQSDVLIGTPVANRDDEQFHDLIGLFVNTLVLRVDVDQELSFTDLLQQVRKVALDGFSHQGLPFERLVEELQPERSRSYTPLFQVMFVYHEPMHVSGTDDADPVLRLGEANGTTVGLQPGTSKCDLMLTVSMLPGGGCSASIEYNSDLFDRETIERMGEHYRTLLAGIVANPQRPVSALSLANEADLAELETVRSRWREGDQSGEPWGQVAGTHRELREARDVAGARNLVEGFERQVQRHPDRIAVSGAGRHLTYRELNQLAATTAHWLRRQGVGRGDRVGVRMERSADLVPVLLGVLKTGAAYVPLDPAQPADRLDWMAEDAGVRLTLTGIPDDSAAEQVDDDRCPASEDDVAYVIYTSGSTGRPKGVVIAHGHVLALLRGSCDRYGFGPDDVWTLFHSYGFDFSVWELWGALAFGGRLVVVPYWVSRSPDGFRTLLLEERVTVLNQTPSAFYQLVDADAQAMTADNDAPKLSDLRLVIFGGEELELRRLTGWFDRYGDQQPLLVNMYGITETTVFVTWRALTRHDQSPAQGSNIGIPIPFWDVYVLDEHGRQVPVGVTGELYVGGQGVGVGYNGRPDLTAERFVPDPFSAAPEARLYRSGDLARITKQGFLEYHGRLDDQIQLRGHRVEPGEIVGVMEAHESVGHCVVVVRDSQLIAYIVPESANSTADSPAIDETRPTVRELPIDVPELRAWASDRLPPYMVPVAFVGIDRLPLTENGKLARKALPEPRSDRSALTADFAAPRNDLESQIANAWAAVLDNDQIGVHDDFFESGGHSVLAARLAVRLRKDLDAQIPLRLLFERPTVAQLAEALQTGFCDADAESPNDVAPSESEIPVVPRDARLPLSPAQQRLWIVEQAGNGAAYSIPLALRLTGSLDIDALRRAINLLVERHEILRSVYAMDSGQPTLRIAETTPLDLPVVEVADETDLLRRLEDEARRPFNLATGPVLRVHLFRVNAEQHVLLAHMHHIVADAASMEVLARELGVVYSAFREQTDPRLPPLDVQYADYAAWQQNRVSAGVPAASPGFWRERLADAPRALNLPVDHPGLPGPGRGAALGFAIDAETANALRALANQRQASSFMVLLAGYAVLLRTCCHQHDLLIGTPVANRDHAQLQRLIGFFVNTLVLRVSFDKEGVESFTDTLDRVRRTTLYAFDHQETPFEDVVALLRTTDDADSSRIAPVHAAFAFQDDVPQIPSLPDLVAEPVPLESHTAKTSITLSLQRESDGSLSGAFEFRSDLFEPTTIQRLIDDYQRLLQAVARDADQSIDSLLDSWPQPSGRLTGVDRTTITDSSSGQIAGLRDRSNLTDAQLLVWLGQRLQPDLALYNIVQTFPIDGTVDSERFRNAFDAVVNGSDALRTVVDEIDGVPQQRVLPRIDRALHVVDMTQAEYDAWVDGRRQRVMSPAECLFDSFLVRLGPSKWIWYIATHHLIADGYSLRLIYQCVADAYTRQATEPVALPPYSEFVESERRYRQSDRYRRDEQYWNEFLANKPAPLNLYGNSRRRVGASIGRLSRSLGAERTERLRQFVRQAGTGDGTAGLGRTPAEVLNNVVLAAAAVWLWRISGCPADFNLGMPLHNRRDRNVKQTIGMFMQVVPVTVHIDSAATIASLVAGIAGSFRRSVRHGRFGVRNPPESPSYDVMVNLIVTEYDNFDGMPTESRWLISGHEHDALSVTVFDFGDLSGNELVLAMDFHESEFDASIRPIAMQQFLNVLDNIIGDPSQVIGEIDLLDDETRQRLDTDTCSPREGVDHADPRWTVTRRFQEQVERVPDAVAVYGQGRELTYRELNRRSDRLAVWLRSNDIGTESIVGLRLEKSPDLIAGLLGVLKSGAAYLPLDPAYPESRIEFMVNDSGAAMVLRELPDLSDVGSGNRHWIEPLPDQAAYVVYTSGSTGRPRGVTVSHRNLVNALEGWINAYGLDNGIRRHLQMASFSFDVFSGDLVRALGTGGTLVLCPRETLLDPAALYELMREQQVDSGEFVPAVARSLMEYLDRTGHDLHFMRLLAVGSDTWQVDEYDRLRSFCGDETRLVNSYGVTEATIDSTWYEAAASHAGDTGRTVPIGRPFPNVSTRILDESLSPAAVGVVGELYLAGAGVTRGYHGQPGLTAAAFVPDPFAATDGARMYRTGDLARWLPGGAIEFLGRSDSQVKVRGFRVELGEIESVLGELDEIREAAVVAREDRLVAFCVGGADADTVRSYAGGRLPEHMVPSLVVGLESLPLTPNGKVDRRQLEQTDLPECDRVADSGGEPRTPIEELLAAQWSELLAAPNVQRDDDFFALGGHSLLAMQAVGRIRDAFGVELPLRTLFEGPTLTAVATAIAAARGTKAGIDHDPIPAVPRVSGRTDEGRPLSFAQQRLWFLDQLEGPSAVYNIPVALRLTGRLDVSALQSAIDQLVRRHEVLRTTFSAHGGQARQHVAETVPVNLTPELAAEADVDQLVADESRRPFDLQRGPLLRGRLLCVSSDQHVLVLTVHHIVADGMSASVFVRELTTAYRQAVGDDARENAPAVRELPALPIQYSDYAVWQRQRLQGAHLESLADGWQRLLEELPPSIDLPTDHPRPPIQSQRGDVELFELDADLTQALERTGREAGTTLFMTALSGWAALLGRYSGQQQMAIGTPVAGRDRIELEPLVGMFVNTVVLPINLSSGPTVAELLSRVRTSALDAFSLSELPFELLVESMAPERNLSQSPLFQVMFSLQSAPPQPPALPGLQIEPIPTYTGTEKFDLSLFLTRTEDGLVGELAYSTDLFERATIQRLIRHFRHILTSMTRDMQTPVDRLELVDADERSSVIARGRIAPSAAHKSATLHNLFEQQTERTPDAVAVIDGDRDISYSELNRWADAIAESLQQQGVGPEARIGVRMERSAEMVAALLGILKTGATYVPLDPAWPEQRVDFMRDDSGARLILDQLPDELSRDAVAKLEHVSRPRVETHPEQLAYVLYTSGSTGRPKGVAITHRSAVALVDWSRGVFSADDIAATLASTSICFDLSVFELFVPLCRGGAVMLVPNALAVPSLPTADRVTLINTVPSAAAALVQEAAIPSGVRVINLAGEVLQRRLVQDLYRSTTSARVYNLYGPSEDTTYSTEKFVRRESERQPTIGLPVAGTSAYILDESMRPVPDGVVGELYLGGPGLARGYLARPGMTAERFVPNPFAGEAARIGDSAAADYPGSRLYATGDLARWLNDGDIEFLGRRDHQVKVRGFRIELGEIESALAECHDVAEATVVLRDGRLVGYLAGATPESVRESLAGSLPDYMIPGVWVELDELPRTPNGKLDRKALPDYVVASGDETPAEPRNDTEAVLVDIWQQVLNVSRIGIHDNFFALGGDSIVSIQIIARARDAGLKLTPKQVFQHQSIAELAAAAEPLASGSTEAEQQPVTGDVPLLPIQRTFLDDDPIDASHFNQAVLLKTAPTLSVDAVRDAWEHVAGHHDALRLRFARDGNGEWRQWHAEPDTAPGWQTVELPEVSSEQELVAAMAGSLDAAQASLDIENGPAATATLFRYADNQPGRLLLVIHHLAVDAVSWRVIIEDLQAACASRRVDQPVRLPPKTTSWQTWAHRLVDYTSTDACGRQFAWWMDTLHGRNAAGDTSNTPPLPVDHSVMPDENTFGSAANVSVSLVRDATESLLFKMPERCGVRPEAALLASLGHVLCDWAGTPAMNIDIESHGRADLFDDVDISRTVGWFTALHPMAINVSPTDTAAGQDFDGQQEPDRDGARLLAIAQHTAGTLDNVPDQGVGFGLLRSFARDRHVRDALQRIPTSPVSFNYLGRFDSASSDGAAPLLEPVAEPVGHTRSPRAPRPWLIEVSASIHDMRLHVNWSYSERLHDRSTIQHLAERVINSLLSLIECADERTDQASQPAVVVQQSDVALTADEMNELAGELDFDGWAQ